MFKTKENNAKYSFLLISPKDALWFCWELENLLAGIDFFSKKTYFLMSSWKDTVAATGGVL